MNFQNIFKQYTTILVLLSSEFLPLASVSNSDVYKAIKRLRPSKSVGVDDIPGFIIKGCTDIFLSIQFFQFFIIYVPSQQPQGQLQTEHR
jgi:hypothetical protein